MRGNYLLLAVVRATPHDCQKCAHIRSFPPKFRRQSRSSPLYNSTALLLIMRPRYEPSRPQRHVCHQKQCIPDGSGALAAHPPPFCPVWRPRLRRFSRPGQISDPMCSNIGGLFGLPAWCLAKSAPSPRFASTRQFSSMAAMNCYTSSGPCVQFPRYGSWYGHSIGPVLCPNRTQTTSNVST